MKNAKENYSKNIARRQNCITRPNWMQNCTKQPNNKANCQATKANRRQTVLSIATKANNIAANWMQTEPRQHKYKQQHK